MNLYLTALGSDELDLDVFTISKSPAANIVNDQPQFTVNLRKLEKTETTNGNTITNEENNPFHIQ